MLLPARPPAVRHSVCCACLHHSRIPLRRCQSSSTRPRPLHLAIIGSGPAGFYSASRVLKKLPDARITMFEQLPVPTGLVRYGVAPDHPDVKKCADTLVDVAKHAHFTFAGNVAIGAGPKDLPLSAVAENYDAILFAYGASRDRKLGIPGEELAGVVSARAFVGWYNGLPEYADLNPDLTRGDTAVVIGQGNVALDVTRILLAPLAELRKTDISEAAVDVLSRSKVQSVKVIGRRGPLQAPYTIKELRELMHLPSVAFAPPPESWDALIGVDRTRLPRQLRRIAEVLERGSQPPLSPSSEGEKAWQLGFLRAPSAFLSSNTRDLEAVGFLQTAFTMPPSSLLTGDAQTDLLALRALTVHPTAPETKTLIRAPLAFRSVGYQSEPLPGMPELHIPFDAQRGIIPNDRHGRVFSPSLGPGGLTAGHVPGMYCAGWVKRGPTGVIASTMADAFGSADALARDWLEGGALFCGGRAGGGGIGGWEAVREELGRRGTRVVGWRDWERIDGVERARGRERGGKEREKFRRVGEMLGVLDG
ncbi:hypothetical protein LTR08_000180 [Meristemomyces frigidus]|nr:hypothetical protein LTR08_000180 [Meristemomyces frigidus]